VEQGLNVVQHFTNAWELKVSEEWKEACTSNHDGTGTRLNRNTETPEPEVLLADAQAQQPSGLPHSSGPVLKDLLGYTETSPAPGESFDRIIALESEVIASNAPGGVAPAWSSYSSLHGASHDDSASQDVPEPPAADEVADPPPPLDNTEGTQLAVALVATQPDVAFFRGVVPTEVTQVPKMRPAPKRKHECGECFNNYASPSALARHVLTHAPCTCVDGSCAQHPFPCTTCGQRFSQTANLQSHINEIHLLVT